MSEAGYSDTPLVKKLGIKPGMRGLFVGRPSGIEAIETFDAWSERIDAHGPPLAEGPFDYIHVFESGEAALAAAIPLLKARLSPPGMLWISWPKKASGVQSSLDGNIVRRIGLDAGLVDIKVCAIDATWSGLKFVIPVEKRRG